MHNMGVDAYSAQIENARTPFDWLSADVTLKLYAGKRHELLIELGKEQIYQDITNWIKLQSC